MENNMRILIWVFILLTSVMVGCVWIYNKVEIDTEKPTVATETPFKAHLKNGQIAVFSKGAAFGDEIVGEARLYNLDLMGFDTINRLDSDSVAAYSVFREEVDVSKSVGVSFLASLAAAAVTPVVWTAIFGSCPTVYSEDGSDIILRGELFSNSIAPMLEARDLVYVGGNVHDSDKIRIEIRNEALETHYLNQLELIEVQHQSGAFIAPTPKNGVLSLNEFKDPISAVTKTGLDLLNDSSELNTDRNWDGYIFDAWPDSLKNPEPVMDHIDLVFPPTENKTALHLKIRNSLFTSMLLYEYYLSGQGIESLNWLGNRLETVGEAVALGGFHSQYMGMRVLQYLDGEYKQTARISNTGPVSWKDLAVPLESAGKDSIRVRLSFLADLWRIQNLRLANKVNEPNIRIISSSGLYDSEEIEILQLNDITAADENYYVNWPGQRIYVDFPVSKVTNDKENSYMLSAQGYYIEWIRNEWIQEAKYPDGIPYDSNLIVSAQQRWQVEKKDLEATFFNSKVPVQ